MNDLLNDAKRWRRLARETRAYAEDVSAVEGRAELMAAAENWERKAAEVEAVMRLGCGPLPPLLVANIASGIR